MPKRSSCITWEAAQDWKPAPTYKHHHADKLHRLTWYPPKHSIWQASTTVMRSVTHPTNTQHAAKAVNCNRDGLPSAQDVKPSQQSRAATVLAISKAPSKWTPPCPLGMGTHPPQMLACRGDSLHGLASIYASDLDGTFTEHAALSGVTKRSSKTDEGVTHLHATHFQKPPIKAA